MDSDPGYEQLVNGTMTPSVTDTDAEESDQEESNKSERKEEERESFSINSPLLSQPSTSEQSADENEITVMEEDLEIFRSHTFVSHKSEHHPDFQGIHSLTDPHDKVDVCDTRSSQLQISDVQTDEEIGATIISLPAHVLPVLVSDVTRVIDHVDSNNNDSGRPDERQGVAVASTEFNLPDRGARTDLAVESDGCAYDSNTGTTTLDSAGTSIGSTAPIFIPAADTPLLSVTRDQQLTVSTPAPTIATKPSTSKEKTHRICHPSKLNTDDSASTSQPLLNLAMGPNARLALRTEQDSEELDLDVYQLKVVEKVETEVDAVSEDVDVSNAINSPPKVQTEDDHTQAAIAGGTDAPPPSFGFSPPSSEDILETGSVVIAPPGTIVFQHAKGEHSYLPPAYQHSGYGFQMPMPILQHPMNSQLIHTPPNGGGRRKITLHLQEDVHDSSRRSFFFRRSSRNVSSSLQSIEEGGIDRGTVTVTWFDGTSSSELQEHVRKTVVRKMNLGSDARLTDLRVIDQSESPPEEIVLSPFIPDGSSFLLRFSTRSANIGSSPSIPQARDFSAPDSPSAAPSPLPSSLDLSKLNAQLLSGKLNALDPPLVTQRRKSALKIKVVNSNEGIGSPGEEEVDADFDLQLKKLDEADDATSKASEHHEDDVMGYNPEDQIEVRLRQIADLMIADRRNRRSNRVMKEKRQVIFVIANYFVLFLSFIAICAELSARSPQWLASLEKQLESVKKCSTDQETLFECVSRGDFAGLMASFVLVLTRSAATKRFFLFGFETPKKLWAVVYESMVTAVCWGVSYIMIRRGMNPDTRSGFLRKYWKDAVYGSLAGFNAAFMKHVLKNLIPQETFEHALHERQLKILSWLPSFK